jgi:hypothetical protein
MLQSPLPALKKLHAMEMKPTLRMQVHASTSRVRLRTTRNGLSGGNCMSGILRRSKSWDGRSIADLSAVKPPACSWEGEYGTVGRA